MTWRMPCGERKGRWVPTLAGSRSRHVGDGSFGFSPDLPFHIRRDRTGFVLASITATGMLVAWLIGVIVGNIIEVYILKETWPPESSDGR